MALQPALPLQNLYNSGLVFGLRSLSGGEALFLRLAHFSDLAAQLASPDQEVLRDFLQIRDGAAWMGEPSQFYLTFTTYTIQDCHKVGTEKDILVHFPSYR